ncbi:MAG TPA: molybdenum cofactor guanylyltransferase [Clostridia bacterium]|nr:molybdenum cofactor guanylyltransferase [Clostridia bacterium]
MNLVLLAGGRSQRMGRPKCNMELSGRLLFEYPVLALDGLCSRCIVVANDGSIDPGDVSCILVHDLIAGAGPLGAIYTGLAASDSWLNLVVAGDMPCASPQLAAAMETYALRNGLDIVYPNIDGLLEPLFAIYSKRVVTVARALLDAGRRSVRELYASASLRVGVVDRQFVTRYDRKLTSFFNVNTPDDLIMARLMMHVREKSLQEECV